MPVSSTAGLVDQVLLPGVTMAPVHRMELSEATSDADVLVAVA
jgi:hypothetical protein